MDFRTDKTKTTYIGREAQLSWLDWAGKTIQPENKIIADIACGGGIYARGFVHLMAKHVFGIDFSEHSLVDAKGFSGHITNLDFMVGEASKTGLASNCVDIVFERALIHHLSEKQKTDNLQEIQRILKMDGLTVIQDRTFEDVTSDHPDYWIRAVLFATFPRLLE